MAWFDRDRTPARFTVVTSVTRGLVLAAILRTIEAGVSGGAVLVWVALTSSGVAVASWSVRCRLSAAFGNVRKGRS